MFKMKMMLKDIARKVYYLCLRCAEIVLFIFPLRNNQIVFINFEGKGYGDNPKYIAESLMNRTDDVDMIWLVDHLGEDFARRIRQVRYKSLKALYVLATSKLIITNTKRDLRIVKKRNQIVIQTWHGSCSFKRIEADAIDTLPRHYIKESMRNSKQTDFFISCCTNQTEEYRRAFWCDCEILETGMPRNDVFFHASETKIQKIKERIGVESNYKILLYAPTFRDDSSNDCYNLDFVRLMNVLERDGYDWITLVRMHPKAKGIIDGSIFTSKVIDVTQFPDMQELLLISDILVTDYSSTIYDFALMKKPIVIFAEDIDNYSKMRGLKEEFFQLPWPICKSNDEVMQKIHISIDNSEEYADQLLKRFGSFDRGNASELICDRILRVLTGN